MKDKNLSEALEKISKAFNEAIKVLEDEQEAYWNSLTKDQQLMVFCAISRRIHKAELEDKGSYRHALYNVFNFGPESYAPAQCAGYLDIHNSIYDVDHDDKLLEAFCEKFEIVDSKKKIREFLHGI